MEYCIFVQQSFSPTHINIKKERKEGKKKGRFYMSLYILVVLIWNWFAKHVSVGMDDSYAVRMTAIILHHLSNRNKSLKLHNTIHSSCLETILFTINFAINMNILQLLADFKAINLFLVIHNPMQVLHKTWFASCRHIKILPTHTNSCCKVVLVVSLKCICTPHFFAIF